MATLGATKVTLADWIKSRDPNGKQAAIIELLAASNPILDDIPFVEGNLPTGHRTTVRTGLPTAIWRKLYQGVPPSKGTKAQVDDACGMLEARCEIDKDLAELNGATSEFRMSEAEPFIESMSQTMASTLFYGDTDADPEKFMGLAPRYSSLSAANAQNIISASGTGSDQTSIWLIRWGTNRVHGIFPKGSMAGLQHTDLGLGDAFDSDNNRYRAYMDHWQWKTGLSLRDWRWAVRICNIDVPNLTGESSAADLVKLMIKAMHRFPTANYDGAYWYMNRTTAEFLDIQSIGKTTSGVTVNVQFNNAQDAHGRPVTTFRGVPIRVTDAILSTEAQVS